MNKKYIILAVAAVGVIGGWIYLVNKWKKDWYNINAPFGRKLGYPECCIKAFCDHPPQLINLVGVGKDGKMRYDAACIDGEYTGFIPCADHAKQILNGEIKLQDLIKNRDSQFGEFPNM